jgi:3-hydroxybutyryl-CoA dehydrogenase
VIRLTDGCAATARAAASGEANLVLLDLALDYAAAPRIALAAAEQAAQSALVAAAGFFQALGKSVSVIGDAPGMVVMRLVAMLANEAAEAVYRGVASASDVDLAMTRGVNYPLGPLAWANRVGLPRIVAVLDNMAAAYGEDRYRTSLLLRRKQESGRRF